MGYYQLISLQVLIFIVLLEYVQLHGFGFNDYTDDSCYTEEGEEGHCLPMRKCQTAQKYTKQNRRPTPCWHFGRHPIICCPTPSLAIRFNDAGTISNEKCFEYASTQFGAPFEVTQFGGEQALPREFPHMAAIGFGDEINIQWLCGGSLISENFVMTAAHCLYSKQFGNAKYVRVGDLNLQRTDDDARPENFKIKKAIRHPEYKPPSQYHDIALIELDHAITISRYVVPACLNTDFDIPENSIPVATGWGQMTFSGASSDHLMKVELKLYGNEQCKKVYSTIPARNLAKGIIDNGQICAGGNEGEEKDTCQGDSGGPLQIRHKQFWKSFIIVGITSFGKGCAIANSPGVYTRVSNYVAWIESTVWPKPS